MAAEDRPARRKVTLMDVASRAGVSKMTASRVFAHPEAVRPETRARVAAAAQALGYRPNLLARGLTTRNAGLVVVLVPELRNAVYAEVVAGIQDSVQALGLQTMVTATGFDPEAEEAALRTLSGWNPAAFVLAGPERSAGTRAFLTGLPTPVIEVMELPERPIGYAVGFSHQDAGAAAADCLIDRGCRSLAAATANPQDTRASRRLAGFVARARARGHSAVHCCDSPAVSSFGLGGELAARILDEAPKTDGIFMANDILALGAMMHLRERGVAVPDEVAVIGFNDLALATLVPGGLSTIRSPRYDIGLRAGGLIGALLRDEEPERVQDTGFSLVRRATA